MSIELNYYEQHIFINSTHFIWDGDHLEWDTYNDCYKEIIDIKDLNKQLLYISDNKLVKTRWITSEQVEAILNLRYFL